MAELIDRYAALHAGFRWHVPGDFNIAEACCTRWAKSRPDAVAAHDAEPAQRRRKPVGGAIELAVGEVGAGTVVGLEADRDRVGAHLRPARAADLGDVEIGRDMPAKRGVQLRVAIGRGAHDDAVR